jgi:hypothetical protein
MARKAKYFSVKWKTAAVQTAFWVGLILGFFLGMFVAMPHV